MSEELPSIEALREAAAAKLGCPAEHLRLEPCGTGKYNTTYFLEGGREPLVLRVAPADERKLNLFYEHRMMRQEPALHHKILSSTTVPVPEIVAYDFSRKLLERDFLLLKKAPGVPLSEASGLSRREFERTLGEVGQVLRQVHAIHGDTYGYLGKHRPMEPQGDWTSAFVVMWNKLLEDIRLCGGYSAAEADALARLLDTNLSLFDRTQPPSLLHMDVWAQNILIGSEGRLTGLLDWDRALYGDPEIEFAVLDYCGISEPAFWEGYGSRRADDSAARKRRIFYLLYELQKYIFIRRVRGKNPSLAASYRQQSLQLASALGLRI